MAIKQYNTIQKNVWDNNCPDGQVSKRYIRVNFGDNMLGAIAGDIISSSFRKECICSTNFKLFSSNSTFTGDTILISALAESILKHKPYESCIKELYSQFPDVEYNNRLKEWIKNGNACQDYAYYTDNPGMIISPIGFAYNSLNTILKKTQKVTSLATLSKDKTIWDYPEIVESYAVASTIFMAKSGKCKKEIKGYLTGKYHYDLNFTFKDLIPIEKYDIKSQDQFRCPNAIIAFLESNSFEDAIRLAVLISGYGSSIVSITGSIAEAFYGEMPKQIKEETLDRLDNKLINIYEKFADKYLN